MFLSFVPSNNSTSWALINLHVSIDLTDHYVVAGGAAAMMGMRSLQSSLITLQTCVRLKNST